jgi:hypothetical protein
LQATLDLEFLLKVKNKMYQQDFLKKQHQEMQAIILQEDQVKEQVSQK